MVYRCSKGERFAFAFALFEILKPSVEMDRITANALRVAFKAVPAHSATCSRKSLRTARGCGWQLNEMIN
jgi:hypothetical protein